MPLARRPCEPHDPRVNATPTNSNRHDGAIRTLRDLLYADPQQPRVSEEEWLALVRSIGAGDQAALRGLYERAHRIVFTLIMRISGNQQTAQELTLDVFHDVWRRAAAYDPQNGPVLGWLMNQARCRALERVRSDQTAHAARPVCRNHHEPNSFRIGEAAARDAT